MGAQALFKTHKSRLESEKKYDHKTKTIYLTVKTQVEGRVSRRNRDQLVEAGIAAVQSLSKKAVADLVDEIFQIKHEVKVDGNQLKEIDKTLAKRSKRVKVNKSKVWKTDFSYRFAFPVDYAYKLAYQASR